MRRFLLALLLGTLSLAAAEDPFPAPPGLQAFARQATLAEWGTRAKASHLLKAIFAPPSKGGLGMTYDDTYTRTVAEAWRDRKANCLTLTAFYIAACRSIGLEARFGESLRVSLWRRVGNTIRNERHVVAILPTGNLQQQLVADFLPELRRGSQMIAPMDPKRALALFYSNRAVELLEGLHTQAALAEAQKSIDVDPSSSVGLNILGVVQRDQGQMVAAEASFRQALKVDPKDGAACGNLEALLRSEGRTAEAEVYRERGLEVRKDDPYFNAFLAQEALENLDLKEARSRIKRAIRLLPQEPEFHLIQARVFLAEGNSKAAIRSLERAQRWASPLEQSRFASKIALLRARKP